MEGVVALGRRVSGEAYPRDIFVEHSHVQLPPTGNGGYKMHSGIIMCRFHIR